MGMTESLEVESERPHLSSTLKTSRTQLTTGELLHLRVAELTEDIHNRTPSKSRIQHAEMDDASDGSDELKLSVPLVFKVWGILPWAARAGAHVYPKALFALALLAVAYEVLEAVMVHRWGAASGATCGSLGLACWHQRGLLSDVLLGASAAVAQLVLGTLRGNKVLLETIAVLQVYAYQQDLEELWRRRSRLDAACMLLLWLLANLMGVLGAWHDAMWSAPSAGAHLRLTSFAITSGISASLTFCLLYVCRALTVMVDLFCWRVVDWPDTSQAVHEWNVLQAVLRKASITVELCFLALQAGAAFALPLLVLDFLLLGLPVQALPSLLPGLLLACGALRLFFLAASITDKCARIPSLINSLSFGHGTDTVKWDTIEYMVHSAAGFYVLNTRLTTAMAVKFMYTWGVVAFALCTKIFPGT